MATLHTIEWCHDHHCTKGFLIDTLYPTITCDPAIPQSAADSLQDALGYNITSQVCMGYPDGFVLGVILPLTIESADALLDMAGKQGIHEVIETVRIWRQLDLDCPKHESAFMEQMDLDLGFEKPIFLQKQAD